MLPNPQKRLPYFRLSAKGVLDRLRIFLHYRSIASKCPLFPSRHKSGTVRLHRQTVHDILKNAFIEAGLNEHIATHSLRKSFAQRLYDKTGDIYLVQELLGHRNISTTQKYLSVNYADAKAAVESIALIAEFVI